MPITLNGDTGTTGNLANGDLQVNGVTVGKGAGTIATNTAVGADALVANTTGSRNSAFGINALKTNTTGASNSSLGINALFSNTTGGTNTAIGDSALNANTTGSNNTALGHQAGSTNSTGAKNTFVGARAGLVATGSNNTIIGEEAGLALSTGAGNTFVGAYSPAQGGAGEQITTGALNTILGAYTGNQNGLDIRTKSNNIVLSDGAGNPRYTLYDVGNVSTSVVDIAPSNSGVGGLHFVTGFNTSGGAQGWWLIATRVNSVTIIASSNATGLTVNFGQTFSVRLNAVTTSGTIQISCTTIS
jgi:hypothetical protein